MRLLVFSYFVSMYIKPLWRNLQRFFFDILIWRLFADFYRLLQTFIDLF